MKHEGTKIPKTRERRRRTKTDEADEEQSNLAPTPERRRRLFQLNLTGECSSLENAKSVTATATAASKGCSSWGGKEKCRARKASAADAGELPTQMVAWAPTESGTGRWQAKERPATWGSEGEADSEDPTLWVKTPTAERKGAAQKGTAEEKCRKGVRKAKSH